MRKRHPADFAGLRERARSRMPGFAFDFVDTGAGSEQGARRNAAALDAMTLTPRFGAAPVAVDPSVSLFGQTYSIPVGVAPMGLAGLAWPGADGILARAAQRAGVPYVLATGASLSIEDAAAAAPDVFWFQLYKVIKDGWTVSNDLIARAMSAGAKVLVLTVDSAARPKRIRDIRNGLVPPFSLTPRMALQAACGPLWLAALTGAGMPKFENVVRYCEGRASPWATADFAVRHITGAFTWDDIARIRKLWPRPLVIKGITHPDDAEQAINVGADGVWISNHGGRVFDPAPATATALPRIVERMAGRATILVDSGIRDGTDVVRSCALGADATFAGRAFLFSVAALGKEGGDHAMRLFGEEIDSALRFLGAANLGALRSRALVDKDGVAPDTGREGRETACA